MPWLPRFPEGDRRGIALTLPVCVCLLNASFVMLEDTCLLFLGRIFGGYEGGGGWRLRGWVWGVREKTGKISLIVNFMFMLI